MSRVFSLHHIVFGTKYRECTINPENAEELYKYLWGALTNHGCHLYRINSMPDHVHMLVDVSPNIALKDLMESIKATSSGWMKRQGKFPIFKGWCKGYFAESVSRDHREGVIEYIKGQQIHHGTESYLQEIKRLYLKYGIKWFDNEMQ